MSNGDLITQILSKEEKPGKAFFDQYYGGLLDGLKTREVTPLFDVLEFSAKNENNELITIEVATDFKNLTGDGPDASGLRSYAKELTGVRKKLYQNGRLGMIIDGTGDDYAKISREKKELEEKGYDCYMVFVNTTLEVALERNRNRDRVLPEKIVVDSHRQVIKNIGGFQGLFGGSNFIIIDNNKDLSPKQAQKRFNMLVKKGISKFIKRPIQNPKGKSWVRKQKMLGENYSELVWNFGKQLILERIDFQQVAKKIMNKYRIRSKLQFSPRATKGDYDFDRDIIKLKKTKVLTSTTIIHLK